MPIDTWKIPGAIFFVGFALFAEFTINRDMYRIANSIKQIAIMAFPLSGSPFRRKRFFTWLPFAGACYGWGVQMRSDYLVTEIAFIVGTGCACIAVYMGLEVLTSTARRVWTGVLAVIVIFSSLNAYDYFCPTVTISPTRVVFGAVSKTDGVSQTYRFRIQNKTDSDIFAVTFNLAVESSSLTLADFRFDVPKSSQKPQDENTPLGRKFGDIGGVNCTDMKNRPVFVRYISHLGPLESREVTLTRINPYAEAIPPSATLPPQINFASNEGGVGLHAKVVDWTRDASVSSPGSRPGLQLQGMWISESMHCGSSSFIVLEPL